MHCSNGKVGTGVTTPISIIGATSLTARGTARINPVIISRLAISNTVSHQISSLVALKAKLPSPNTQVLSS